MGSGASANQSKGAILRQQICTKSQHETAHEAESMHLLQLRLSGDMDVKQQSHRDAKPTQSISEPALKDVKRHRDPRAMKSENSSPKGHWLSALQNSLLEAMDVPEASVLRGKQSRDKHVKASRSELAVKDAKPFRKSKSTPALQKSSFEAMDVPEARVSRKKESGLKFSPFSDALLEATSAEVSGAQGALKDAKPLRKSESTSALQNTPKASVTRKRQACRSEGALEDVKPLRKSQSVSALQDSLLETVDVPQASVIRKKQNRLKLSPFSDALLEAMSVNDFAEKSDTPKSWRRSRTHALGDKLQPLASRRLQPSLPKFKTFWLLGQ